MENKKEEYSFRKKEKEKERLSRIRPKKIKRIALWALPVFFIVGGIYLWLNRLPENPSPEQPKITVFYSPTCACCADYMPYLKRNGFSVEAVKTQDMLSIKEQYQIPQKMESCHTSAVGDYFVEGHMPAEIIKKLLAEKPDILGIALPGMPQGSPGMSGFKNSKWTIYGLADNEWFEFLSL